MAAVQGVEPLDVAAGDEVGHAIAGFAPGALCGLGVARPVGHREYGRRPGYSLGGVTASTLDPFELRPFLVRQRPQRLLLAPAHAPSHGAHRTA